MRAPRPPLWLLAGMLGVLALALGHTAEIRARAEAALGSGMPAREAELARGFVLGQDERIDPRTREDFRRSGLSHLLSVSGQNVALLALLAMPALAALGIPLRARLLWVLALIVVYVPLAGAGPSIQRAGVMGALSVIAVLAGRRASRFYALLMAAIATLAIEPRIGADVGWQLSFAAVLGILLLGAPLRAMLTARFGARGLSGALAEGAAITTAATLATAPLIAFHFGAISTTTLLANLLALPAVAPAMWLGMLAAAAGQLPGCPLAPVNAVNSLLLAYIAQVAAWCGRPEWAYLQVKLGVTGLVASYATIAVAAVVFSRLRRRWAIAARRRRPSPAGAYVPRTGAIGHLWRRPWAGPAIGLGMAAIALAWAAGGGAGAEAPPAGLRVTVLDVGQGDAILMRPAGAPAVLVDGGPPGEGLAAKLRAAGVERLGAAIVTHDQSDHAAGIVELLGEMPVGRVLYGTLGAESLARVRASGSRAERLAAGGELRSGRLRFEVLWPPAELLASGVDDGDPNHLSLVLLARWRDFSMLLCADAEAEATPLEPGPIDVLKVAHHGSDDAGLGDLLDRSRPRLAVISVGDGNPFGHPTPGTLQTLSSHGVRVARTDRDGSLVIDVRHRRFALGFDG